jgi:hypothetical protein
VDPEESFDLSEANPEIVADLLNSFTAFETTIDKPRHAGLTKAPSSINLNNAFVFDPQPSPLGNFISNLTLADGNLRNGNFNAGGEGGVQTYAETPSWENIGTGTLSENFTNTSLSANGSRNAIIAESNARAAGLDTGHTLSTGEIFRVTFQWRDASNWNDSSDLVAVTLFTTSDDSISGPRNNLQRLLSRTSKNNSTYQTENFLFNPIITREEGKRLFVEVNAAQTGNGFARFDDFKLQRGTLGQGGQPTPSAFVNWSQESAWIDPQTNSPDTLLRTDSFPGCILDFPVTQNFSYETNNDLARISDLTFMLNSLRLTGSFDGASPHSATLSGSELLFTENLDGAPANLALEAMGPAYSFVLKQDLILYNDLKITGNGNATFVLEGQISEYQNPTNLSKSGTSTLLIKSSPKYAGTTSITEGEIILAENVTFSSDVIISEEAILSGCGTLTGSLSGAGTISPGQGIGTLTIQNASPQKLHLEIDGNQADHLVSTGILDLSKTTLSWSTQNLTEIIYPIITYNSLVGGFQNTHTPPGYLFDYNYQGNKIALVRSENAYQIWAQQTHALSGGNALFGADPDLDGIPNGLEFFTGSNPAKFTKNHPLKASRISSSTAFSYPLSSLGKATLFRLQSSTDLINWDDSFPGGQLPILKEEEHFYSPGLGKFSQNIILPSDETRFFRFIHEP